MDTLRIGRKDLALDAHGFLSYDRDINFEGNVRIEGGLGHVRFKFGIRASGSIVAESGSGIESGYSIRAGEGIEAGESIIVLRAGLRAKFISCLRVAVGFDIRAQQNIEAEVKRGEVVLGEVKPPNPVNPKRLPLALHVHHDRLFERLAVPIENRIAHIKSYKPANEVETRLRLLKVIEDQEGFEQAINRNDYEAIEALHKKECPMGNNCPWDGWTIFPKKKSPI